MIGHLFGFKYTGCNLRKEDQQYGAWLRATMARFYRSPPTPQQEDLQRNSDRPTPPNLSRLNITPIPDVSDQWEMNMLGSEGMDQAPTTKKSFKHPILTDREVITNFTLFSHRLQEIDRQLNKFPNPLGLNSETRTVIESSSLISSETCMDMSNPRNKEALPRSQDKQEDIVVISSTHVMKNVESMQIMGS